MERTNITQDEQVVLTGTPVEADLILEGLRRLRLNVLERSDSGHMASDELDRELDKKAEDLDELIKDITV